jgi:hypothetical protein
MDNGNSGKAVVKRPKLIAEKVGKSGSGEWVNKYACPCCGTPFEMRPSQVKYLLRNGTRVSCGCLSEHAIVSKMLIKLTGDVSVSPAEFSELMGPYVEYRPKLASVWDTMNARCGNLNYHKYPRYGGRGIKNLFADFEQFFLWSVANGYDPSLQVDRIDNDGNYEPANCRWVDSRENSRNRGNNVLNPAKVKQIRAMRATGMLQRDIAAEMGITSSHVSNVLAGKRWSDTT